MFIKMFFHTTTQHPPTQHQINLFVIHLHTPPKINKHPICEDGKHMSVIKCSKKYGLSTANMGAFLCLLASPKSTENGLLSDYEKRHWSLRFVYVSAVAFIVEYFGLLLCDCFCRGCCSSHVSHCFEEIRL